MNFSNETGEKSKREQLYAIDVSKENCENESKDCKHKCKSNHTAVFETVGIKEQYVIRSCNKPEQSTVLKERIDTKSYKAKRAKTDVGLKERTEYDILCRHIASERPCPFGEKCTYEHDISTFFERRLSDIGPSCPVWKDHGYCPAGLNCRWALSHTSVPSYILESKPEAERLPIIEMNEGNILAASIRKKTYRFECDTWLADIKDQSITATYDEQFKQPIGSLADAEPTKLDFRGKIYIAPLTTVGNLPFRRVCVDLGANITCSEMAMCGNLLKSQSSEWALLRRHPCERYFGIQLATGRVEEAASICEVIRRDLHVDFVDLNTGCPIDAIGKAGAGAGLLMKVGRMKRIIRGMLSSLQEIPLVVKTRTGDHENTTHRLLPQVQSLRGCTGARVQGIVIHGRTKQERYSSNADWKYIRYCVQNCDSSLPLMSIVGNGDIFDYQSYQTQLADCVLQGIMIGRGALIKPWICTEIAEQRIWDISAQERFDLIGRFVNYGLEHWGSDEQGVARTRRFLYVPVGLLERPQTMNQRPCEYIGRSDLESLLGSRNPSDWIRISERFLGSVGDGFSFIPKHRSTAYSES